VSWKKSRLAELPSSVKGKQAELAVIGRLLEYGFHLYTPLLDIKGIDCLVDVGEGNYKEIQIKYRAHNPTFQVRKLKPRESLYIVCCFGDEIPWIIPSKIFYKIGKVMKGDKTVSLNIGREGSTTYERLRQYSGNFIQLAKGATTEVRRVVERASKRIDAPHLTQTDYALAVLDNLSMGKPLSTKEIVKRVWISLYARLSQADKEVLKGGRERWKTTLSYTLSALRKNGLIKEQEKNQFAITKEGTDYLCSIHKGWHFVPGHVAGPFGYTGTVAIGQKGTIKL
jgi:hypothetical protein